MKLKRLDMVNFRSFYGEHSIEFAEDEKNTTLILGINNAGKTGIYRAIMFGLYGERKLKQDSELRKIHLVNFKALEEESLVEAKVRIYIESQGEEYIVTRSIKGANIGDKVEESSEVLSLDFKDRNGEHHINYKEDPMEIQSIINGMLDENIKEFFLFDGEKIETLARADSDSRQEVKNGIIKLMQIDKLENVKDTIRSIHNSERRRITKKSENNRLNLIQSEIEEVNFNIDKNKNHIYELEKNLNSISQELESIEFKLKENTKTRELYNEKESLEKELESISEKIISSKSRLKDYLFEQSSSMILFDYGVILNKKIEEKLIKQDDLISIHVLNSALKNGICSCCNQTIGEEEINYINEVKKNYKYSNITTILEFILRNLNVSSYEMEKYKKLLGKELDEISRYNNEKNIIKKKIENIEEELKDTSQSEQELSYIEKQKEDLIRIRINDESKKNNIESELNELEEKLKVLNLEHERALKQNKDLDYEVKRLELIKSIDDKLTKKYDEYVDETRHILGAKTTETFKELIDFSEKSLVRNIVINNKYEMDIEYADGLNVTQDISQGQQMIVALSFITSLAKIASKSDGRVDYPLFMDTPFGRLSKENRKNLILNLPDLTNQWIPLLTDTDYTDYEKEIFMESGKVGKIYIIEKISEKHSEIRDITNERCGF